MGKPVICSRTKGQIGIIQDGVNGFFVPQGDPQALREKIVELWNNPEQCKQMGLRGRRFIEAEHNMEQFVERIKEELVSVLPASGKAKKYASSQVSKTKRISVEQ